MASKLLKRGVTRASVAKGTMTTRKYLAILNARNEWPGNLQSHLGFSLARQFLHGCIDGFNYVRESLPLLA